MSTQAATFQFGPFRLSVIDRQLFRGETPIPLTPKVFETLVVLVEEAGRLVQKDEFFSRIWPDTVVETLGREQSIPLSEEVGLAHNISQLRRVLGDGRDDPRFIQTVPSVAIASWRRLRSCRQPHRSSPRESWWECCRSTT